MADTTTFAFELVSPERLLLSEPAQMVVIPGEDGDFGVMAGHAPFISTLRPGAIAIFKDGKVERRIFVAGGFAEVTASRCTVLAEEAEPLEGIDRAALETRIKILSEDAAESAEAEARAAAAAQLAIARAMLIAIDRPVYR
jgi:F-type H+-transporting ATPase subunit epsilon